MVDAIGLEISFTLETNRKRVKEKLLKSTYVQPLNFTVWTSENGRKFVLLGSSRGREGEGFDWLIKFPETELLTEENFSYLFS